jgi:hypothetical protein
MGRPPAARSNAMSVLPIFGRSQTRANPRTWRAIWRILRNLPRKTVDRTWAVRLRDKCNYRPPDRRKAEVDANPRTSAPAPAAVRGPSGTGGAPACGSERGIASGLAPLSDATAPRLPRDGRRVITLQSLTFLPRFLAGTALCDARRFRSAAGWLISHHFAHSSSDIGGSMIAL